MQPPPPGPPSGAAPTPALRVRGLRLTAALLGVAAALAGCAHGRGRSVPPPPPPGATTGAPAAASPASKRYAICRTRVCQGGDPRRRQYFDERRRRYYFFDPVRKGYYWEDGTPRT